jgi:hypothetical protein
MAAKPHPRNARERQLESQQITAELDEAERRLAGKVETALAVPPHMIDRVIKQLWDNEIVANPDYLAALGGWMDDLVEDDPDFLRHVFERWLKYRRTLPMPKTTAN